MKGALAGLIFGGIASGTNRNSTLYWKKIKLFADVSRTNELKMFWAVTRNSTLLGMALWGSNSLMMEAFMHGKTDNI